MRLILLVAVCAFALATFIPFVSSKTIYDQYKDELTNRKQNNEHDTFFNSLTPEEQVWLMKISVMYAEDIELFPEIPAVEQPEVPSVEQPENPSVEQPDDPKGSLKFKRKAPTDFMPFPIEDETPSNLVAGLLNGQIPREFQRGFTSWIKQRYNLTKENFSLFRTSGSFCPPHTTNCPEFGDIGAECCPFG